MAADAILLLQLPAGAPARPPFDPDVVKNIYATELNGGKNVDSSRLMVLELTGFLENYLLPNFNAATASFEHIMCIILV